MSMLKRGLAFIASILISMSALAVPNLNDPIEDLFGETIKNRKEEKVAAYALTMMVSQTSCNSNLSKENVKRKTDQFSKRTSQEIDIYYASNLRDCIVVLSLANKYKDSNDFISTSMLFPKKIDDKHKDVQDKVVYLLMALNNAKLNVTENKGYIIDNRLLTTSDADYQQVVDYIKSQKLTYRDIASILPRIAFLLEVSKNAYKGDYTNVSKNKGDINAEKFDIYRFGWFVFGGRKLTFLLGSIAVDLERHYQQVVMYQDQVVSSNARIAQYQAAITAAESGK